MDNSCADFNIPTSKRLVALPAFLGVTYVCVQVLLQVQLPPRARLPSHQAGAAVQPRRPAAVPRRLPQRAHVRHSGLGARGGVAAAGWRDEQPAAGPAWAGKAAARRSGGAGAPGVGLISRRRSRGEFTNGQQQRRFRAGAAATAAAWRVRLGR
jgi:hypothetical protein